MKRHYRQALPQITRGMSRTPSLANTSGQSGRVASATTKVCRNPARTFVSCGAGPGTCKGQDNSWTHNSIDAALGYNWGLHDLLKIRRSHRCHMKGNR